jgi:DNA-binding XRE family transcriptional regulator
MTIPPTIGLSRHNQDGDTMTMPASARTKKTSLEVPAGILAQILGRRLRYYRARLGVNQVEIARRASLTRTYLSALEHGKAGLPRLLTLVRLAAGLDVDVAELVRRN